MLVPQSGSRKKGIFQAHVSLVLGPLPKREEKISIIYEARDSDHAGRLEQI
jgi:hypothetical protein